MPFASFLFKQKSTPGTRGFLLVCGVILRYLGQRRSHSQQVGPFIHLEQKSETALACVAVAWK